MVNYNINADYSNLEVLYEDNHIIAVRKPSNMLVQGDSSGSITLIDVVRKYLAEKYDKKGNVFLGLVHRLDRPTSGVILFGKTSKGASRLCEQFKKRVIKKQYIAIVEGEMDKGETIILDNYIKNNNSRIIITNKNDTDKKVKIAKLSYNVMEVKGNLSLIRIQLITGRKHQIRVQFANIGYPIYGDKKYGSVNYMNGGTAIALLCQKIAFLHPISNEKIVVISRVPNSWKDIFK